MIIISEMQKIYPTAVGAVWIEKGVVLLCRYTSCSKGAKI